MTTLQRIELCCPVCSTTYSSQSVQSTNSFGGKRTDFHERAAGTQPLPYFVHTCCKCGFTGVEQDFSDEREPLDALLKAQLRDALTPRVVAAAGTFTGSEKYELAALAAEVLGRSLHHQADLWLRAAWCCVDEQDTEAERYYRRLAAWRFEEALGTFDGVPQDERAVFTYLVGELWRRIGDTKQARAWFDRVEAEVVERSTQQWVIDVARQQRDCPREWFG